MSDRREYTVRTATFLLAVVLTTSGCGGVNDSASEPELSSKEPSIVNSTPINATPLACGAAFQPPAGGDVDLTGRFSATASAGERMATGTVEVTSRVAVSGTTYPRAEMFLVRSGRIVTLPVAQDAMGVRLDLAPGQVQRLPGDVTLESCAPGGGSVPPGGYELFARVVITSDDGKSVTTYGGPFPFEVR